MNNQSEKPIEEMLRGIPKDHRICIPFQWAEDGRETGHHYIPVGRHAHRAADEIAALREKLVQALAIARKYEPDEKTSYVKYASDEIAELLKEEGK